MRRASSILGILAALLACDKQAAPPPESVVASVDVAARPPLLFLAFGDRNAPRLVPVAAVADGHPVALTLPPADWRALDSLYFRPGTSYPLYRDGRPAGTITIVRGMWGGESPLYDIPGCRNVMPMATGTLAGAVASEANIEAFATTAPAVARDSGGAPLPDTLVQTVGRRLATTAALGAEVDSTDLDSLVFSARALRTGGTRPTIVATFLDPNAGDLGPGAGHTNHVFVIADDSGTGYTPSLQRVQAGEARTVEFWRLLDNLDVDGDGRDELLVEAWRYASDNDLLILARRGAAWREVLRLPQRWCGDPKAPPKP